MAVSGWGLAPGTLEKNVARSLGGKYGAIGNNPSTVSEMLRQKYAAGLTAKRAREELDLSKTIEANRRAESERDFGLETEKFGFTKEQAAKEWDRLQQQYELDKLQVTSSIEQAELDRKLRERQLELDDAYRKSEAVRQASEFAQTLNTRTSEFDKTMDWQKESAGLDESWRAAQLAFNEKQRQDTLNDQAQQRKDEQEQLTYSRLLEQQKLNDAKVAQRQTATPTTKASPTGALAPTASKTSASGTPYYRSNGRTFVYNNRF